MTTNYQHNPTYFYTTTFLLFSIIKMFQRCPFHKHWHLTINPNNSLFYNNAQLSSSSLYTYILSQQTLDKAEITKLKLKLNVICVFCHVFTNTNIFCFLALISDHCFKHNIFLKYLHRSVFNHLCMPIWNHRIWIWISMLKYHKIKNVPNLK